MVGFFSKTVLVAPLDWGLGHATRCIPIIKTLIDLNHSVIIASSSSALTLLQNEFPDLLFEKLSEYNPTYNSSGQFTLSMLQQSPKLLKTIFYEHRQLQALIEKHDIDLIISDNRYGIYSKKVPSIFITHQINLQLGKNLSLFEKPVNLINHYFIGKHKECWVPDVRGAHKISGVLSSNGIRGKRFIGPLSRFTKNGDLPDKKYHLIVLLSGQEPQRTELESLILNEVKNFPFSCLLIRGSFTKYSEKNTNNIEIRDFVSAKELQHLLLSSEIILSRAGYSSIMDFIRLGKRAILIPTPGQTEQEYLAKHLKSLGYFYSVEQNKFSLKVAIDQCKKFQPPVSDQRESLLKEEIERVIDLYC
ncbi:MAG: glycosyltransferase [Chitinophagales bacterium]|nr:glycosyltransferase [Chitinophagales bacterium]